MKIYNGILVGAIIVLYFFILMAATERDTKPIEKEIEANISANQSIQEPLPVILNRQFEEIERIARNVSDSNIYIRRYPNIFDCTDFSRELVRQLGERGYNASCIFGMLVERTSEGNSTFVKRIPHTWVVFYSEGKEIFIEATGGYVIEGESYKKEYEERVRGKCI